MAHASVDSPESPGQGSSARVIRVLIANTYMLVRMGVCSLIERMEGVEVVAETGDGLEAVQLAHERCPNIAILGISMPGLNGLEVTARLARECPDMRVLILSMHNDKGTIRRAFEAGATGYVSQDATLTDVEHAIRSVAQGRLYVSAVLSKHLVTEAIREEGAAADLLARLSPRQREVLRLIVEGHSTKQIALLLQCSVKTVETHRSHLMDRLNIYDVPRLVRFAIRTGLISPAE